MKFKAFGVEAHNILRIILLCGLITCLKVYSEFYGNRLEDTGLEILFYIAVPAGILCIIWLLRINLVVKEAKIYRETVIFGLKIKSVELFELENVFIAIDKDKIGFSRYPFVGWDETDFALAVMPLAVFSGFWKGFPSSFFHMTKFKAFLQKIFKDAPVIRLGQRSLSEAKRMNIQILGNVKLTD